MRGVLVIPAYRTFMALRPNGWDYVVLLAGRVVQLSRLGRMNHKTTGNHVQMYPVLHRVAPDHGKSIRLDTCTPWMIQPRRPLS